MKGFQIGTEVFSAIYINRLILAVICSEEITSVNKSVFLYTLLLDASPSTLTRVHVSWWLYTHVCNAYHIGYSVIDYSNIIDIWV